MQQIIFWKSMSMILRGNIGSRHASTITLSYCDIEWIVNTLNYFLKIQSYLYFDIKVFFSPKFHSEFRTEVLLIKLLIQTQRDPRILLDPLPSEITWVTHKAKNPIYRGFHICIKFYHEPRTVSEEIQAWICVQFSETENSGKLYHEFVYSN